MPRNSLYMSCHELIINTIPDDGMDKEVSCTHRHFEKNTSTA